MVHEWKDIPGYEGQYQVNRLGHVKSLARFKNIDGWLEWHPDMIIQSSLKDKEKVTLYKEPQEKAFKRFSKDELIEQAFTQSC